LLYIVKSELKDRLWHF